MSSLVPIGLALLGVGMFSASYWIQEAYLPVVQALPEPAAYQEQGDEVLPVCTGAIP